MALNSLSWLGNGPIDRPETGGPALAGNGLADWLGHRPTELAGLGWLGVPWLGNRLIDGLGVRGLDLVREQANYNWLGVGGLPLTWLGGGLTDGLGDRLTDGLGVGRLTLVMDCPYQSSG